jgi:LacI family transcriptional regulator
LASTTINDIAKLAGVSIATVSYVINNSRRVSPEIADRVQKVIDELDYRPDETARSLRNKRTCTIGLIIPDNANPFFAEIAKGVEDAGYKSGYSVLLCNSNSMIEREIEYLKLLLAKRVDGIVLASTSHNCEHINKMKGLDVPVQLFYRNWKLKNSDIYEIDNEFVGYKATQYLLDLGHRKIAHIKAKSYQSASGKREVGYIKALQEFGINPNQKLMPRGDNLISGGERCGYELISRNEDFTAVFAANDAMAIGVMRAFRDSGISVPDDVSIIGVDDIILASYSEPPLTTISQPKYEAGIMAAENLIDRMEGKYNGSTRHINLKTQLVVRNSTKSI